MKQKEKDLLLQDLCSRLPYGVIAETPMGKGHVCDINLTIFGTNIGVNINPTIRDTFDIEDIRLYLFPLSSMTEEQKKEYRDIISPALIASIEECDEDENNFPSLITIAPDVVSINWCNKNHFDYNGLIEKGLALDATGLNIY